MVVMLDVLSVEMELLMVFMVTGSMVDMLSGNTVVTLSSTSTIDETTGNRVNKLANPNKVNILPDMADL
jgi:hypothetical protein